MKQEFFPVRKDLNPTIYAYSDTNPQYNGYLKIGFTTRSAKERVKEQYPTQRPGRKPYSIVLIESAIRVDGSSFTDHDIHKLLIKKGFKQKAREWFECNVSDVKNAILEIRHNKTFENIRSADFKMRPEQLNAVNVTSSYFKSLKKTQTTPHFLWNAKMRFGKTFASYQLALKMKWKKILVMTFKPAVQSAWEEDLLSHIDFNDWQFVSRKGRKFEDIDKNKPFVCFGSFQDYLGKNKAGGIKPKNEWVHLTNWDCVIFDEYHYGAWRDSAKELFDSEEKEEIKFVEGEGIEYFDEKILPITTNHYLYLSGTPFRALESGEFIEEQIFNWTYSDEQKSKLEWKGKNNPYLALPRMVLLTYQLPNSIKDIAVSGEFNEFNLNEFFSAKGNDSQATFIHKNEVQKWLDLIRGSYLETTVDNLRLGSKKPPLPFYDTRLLKSLSHTFWFLPSVASCFAMKNLIGEKQNNFYQQYKVIVAAGNQAGMGVDALKPVYEAMDDPLKSKTITLSCMKLITGVSVKPWTGIFMLRNSSTPETYFQAAFRVQTPWEIKNEDQSKKSEILKEECYIFDFAPDRALRQISDYSCRLVTDDISPEKKVRDFINFLPVLSYDGMKMEEIDAEGILEIAFSGTTSTLLARRWESVLLVNVDNMTLERLLSDDKAMEALMNIEGFRSLRNDIETIINKTDSINKLKSKANDEDLNNNEKKQLSETEKEVKSKRKIIQEKLIKFATRIPIFMYLTDYREKKLEDVISKIEPGLFKKVTGLSVDDFRLLKNLNVFNNSRMNDAIAKFKRIEDASLTYSGIITHDKEDVGLFDTTITRKEFYAQI